VAGLVDENLGPSLDFVCRWIPGRIRLGRDDFYRLRPSISSILAQAGAAIMGDIPNYTIMSLSSSSMRSWNERGRI
jgi:hypothetical protein